MATAVGDVYHATALPVEIKIKCSDTFVLDFYADLPVAAAMTIL